MSKERHPSGPRQLELFGPENVPDGGGEAGSGPAPIEERPTLTANERRRALPATLMEEVCRDENLNRALDRVCSNRGAPGVDRMPVEELGGWLRVHRETLVGSLLSGSFEPAPVRGVEIPKPGGGQRQLGIPTVIDRLVQQSIAQVLEPILDPTFSDSSFGFRPGRSAHQALAQARRYVSEGRDIVVDIDLEKFFDRVNHDILIARLARHLSDKRLLGIIGRFLRAGMMHEGVCLPRREGTPQGGPLSPLLANLLLDDLDQELERRGHCFCRYADDCNIYVRSQASGERVMDSVTRFLEKRLKLKVNREKSAVGPVWERKFLGHRLLSGSGLGVAPKSLERFKERVRQITRRNRGVSLERMIEDLNSFLRGWVAYFRYAQAQSHLQHLDAWVRRKLRCFRLKQCKRPKAIRDFLVGQGVEGSWAWRHALSGKGWWRLSNTPQTSKAMSNRWFDGLGLVSLWSRHQELNR
jgi:RNA-directed DNA polymerase